MFFKKSIQILMEEKFNFLTEFGFQKKKYQRGGDLEIIFVNDKNKISIMYYYGINSDYKKLYTFDVIIEDGNERRRLVECYHLFDKQELHQLEQKRINNKIREQINLYSVFLKKNINKLIRK